MYILQAAYILKEGILPPAAVLKTSRIKFHTKQILKFEIQLWAPAAGREILPYVHQARKRHFIN